MKFWFACLALATITFISSARADLKGVERHLVTLILNGRFIEQTDIDVPSGFTLTDDPTGSSIFMMTSPASASPLESFHLTSGRIFDPDSILERRSFAVQDYELSIVPYDGNLTQTYLFQLSKHYLVLAQEDILMCLGDDFIFRKVVPGENGGHCAFVRIEMKDCPEDNLKPLTAFEKVQLFPDSDVNYLMRLGKAYDHLCTFRAAHSQDEIVCAQYTKGLWRCGRDLSLPKSQILTLFDYGESGQPFWVALTRHLSA